ncbi:MAG: SAM-dependent methyltransferase [Myxococcales bacterium]|nr:SAM-dependent methyltransferase [Myxococcales bacterium]
MSSPFPLYLPPDARRLFQSESLVRRMAQLAHWDSKARLVEFFGSLPGMALAKALDCELTVVEPAGKHQAWLQERARAAGVNDLVSFEPADPLAVSLPKAKSSGIFSLGRVTGHMGAEAKRLRPFLAERGRLGLTSVVKVSRLPNEKALAAWQARLGAPLLLPREALLAMEAEGFEPELVETAGEAELDEYYQAFEAALAKLDASKDDAAVKAAREELALYRELGGRTGVTFAFILGRRKEPGEKPPMSRDSG